jgi:hypothetical protein
MKIWPKDGHDGGGDDGVSIAVVDAVGGGVVAGLREIAAIAAVVLVALIAVGHLPIRTIAAFQSLPNSQSFQNALGMLR